MRKVIFWLHLSAALTAGIVIVIMSLTGTLLMYEKQIAAWADGYRIEAPAPSAAVSVERLIESAQAAKPGSVAGSVTVLADPAAPASVNLGRDGTLFLNPYTAQVLGEGSKPVRSFFRTVTDWHRWLAAEGPDRTTGRAITGAANLLFLFVVLSGLVIWWPKTWTRASIRSVVFFRGGLAGKARDFNWHNVIGFWSAIPLAFIVASAATISYPWANDLLFRLAGSEPPPRPAPAAPAASPAASGPAVPQPVTPAGLDAVFEAARRHTPEWRTLTLRLAASTTAPVTVSVDTGVSEQRPDKKSTLTIERGTGAIVKHEGYDSQTRGRQWRTWARWIHTGEAFGLPGQTIAGIVSFGAVILAWTGVALTWRRFRAWRARRARP